MVDGRSEKRKGLGKGDAWWMGRLRKEMDCERRGMLDEKSGERKGLGKGDAW